MTQEKRSVTIVGAGLIGLCTAHHLNARGVQVTVLDRQSGPGLETSFANGSILTPSMSDPWNAPGCWRTLLASLGRSDLPLQLRLAALPSLVGWGLRFLEESSPSRYHANTRRNLNLAVNSLDEMEAIRRETQIAYNYGGAGTLRIFRDTPSLESAWRAAQNIAIPHVPIRRLAGADAVALEPGLDPIASEIAGAIHYPNDESGDAFAFCSALHENLKARGVDFQFGVSVTSITKRGGRAVHLKTDAGDISLDQLVVAAGSYSTRLLRTAGIDLPVRPAKGYSITIPRRGGDASLAIPVVDDALHAVIAPLGDVIRVAGTAEFAGFDLRARPERIDNLVTLLRSVLPEYKFDAGDMRAWCGLRPMCADGVPLISPTLIANLWINTGHGHLGWTMAAGSGRLLADMMTGAQTLLDPAHYALSRFA
jgi:D-amino-acid dehydrogenase